MDTWILICEILVVIYLFLLLGLLGLVFYVLVWGTVLVALTCLSQFRLKVYFFVSGVYLDRRIVNVKSRIMYSKHLLSKITTSCNRSIRLYSALPAPNTNPKIQATGVSTTVVALWLICLQGKGKCTLANALEPLINNASCIPLKHI